MTWALRLAAVLAALLFLRWLWFWFWRSGWKRLFEYALGRVERPAPPPAHRGTVKRDPVCGTFVAMDVAVVEQAPGETLYFCSERCRAAYSAQQKEAAPKVG